MPERTIKGVGIDLVTGCPDRQECMGCEMPLMHVPRCESCRWWDQQETISLHDSVIPKECGYCEVLGIGRPPDFGCTQWEPMEENPAMPKTKSTERPNLPMWENLIAEARKGNPKALEALRGLEAFPEVWWELEGFAGGGREDK